MFQFKILQFEIGVEPKVDGVGEKWMVISHEGVKMGWVKVVIDSEPL